VVRFYLFRSGPITEDIDISEEKLKDVYNADLANGLGNLFERIFRMVIDYETPITQNDIDVNIKNWAEEAETQYKKDLENYRLFEALRTIFNFTKKIDQYINEKEPWNLRKDDGDKLKLVLNSLFSAAEQISEWILPFMPTKAEQVKNYIQKIKEKKVSKEERLNLFPRINAD